MERITSKTNRIVKDAKKLITSSRERKSRGLFVLEGARLSFDVLNSLYKPEYILCTEAAYDKYKSDIEKLVEISKEAYLITDEISEKLSDTQSSQGIFAICKIADGEPVLGDKIIALDNMQDPSNIGAVFRTAEALGIDGIITYNCCDIYNPKVLRASMGGVLRLRPYETDDLEAALRELKKTHGIYSTVPSSDAVKITRTDFTSPCVCVIGNEANGVEENIKALSDALITIPMKGRAESLNAAAAAAITMWEMLR